MTRDQHSDSSPRLNPPDRAPPSRPKIILLHGVGMLADDPFGDGLLTLLSTQGISEDRLRRINWHRLVESPAGTGRALLNVRQLRVLMRGFIGSAERSCGTSFPARISYRL